MKKKKIIAITSGLGNQLFQYALYLHMSKLGGTTIVYPYAKHLNQHNGLELSRLFKDRISILKKVWYIDMYISIFNWVKYIVLGISRRLKFPQLQIFLNILPYDFIVFPEWGDFTFMPSISKEIENTFVFPKISDSQNLEILRKIINSESVSIHIRRGDYQSQAKWRCVLGDICGVDYYENAISKIMEKIESPAFFIFSDDIKWARKNLNITNATYIDCNTGIDSYKDLVLMSSCKHNILSNSTFSLWGAWLNKNINKIVIAPRKWHNVNNDTTYKMYVPSGWILIDNTRPNISIKLSLRASKEEFDWILNQNYNDFELFPTYQMPLIEDSRIKKGTKLIGNFHFDIADKYELKKYKNPNYLYNKLLIYLDEKCKTD